MSTPNLPSAFIVKNQHSNNILDKGTWCENCFRLISGGLECQSSWCLEINKVLFSLNAASDRRNQVLLNAFSEREVDERMKRLYDEIITAK
jgi:hypothetical protein